MTLSPRRVVVLLVLATLLAILGYFYQRTQYVGIEDQNRVALDLRELGKLDAEWNVDILRARQALAPDYAALSAPLPRMHMLRERLRAALQLAPGPQPRRAFDELVQALAAKEALVARFKSENEILRLAMDGFAPAVADLKTELAGIEGATAPGRLVRLLDTHLNTLLSDVLRYDQAPVEGLRVRIERTLLAMELLKSAFSPAVGTVVEQLSTNARLIVRHRPLENALQARIEAAASGAALDRLGSLFDKAFDQGQVVQQRYRSYLFAYSGGLLVLLAYAARRLRRSYFIIGEVNRRLQAANATLEQRVAERTAELEEQSRQLKQLALHDSLTGLINYGQLTRLLEHALLRAGRRDSTVVVMFIDLDGFKAVNDTYGHASGDQVLIEVARRVAACLRKEDALARLGGDEFVILLEEAGGQAGARRVAELALAQIRGVDNVAGNPVAISASIGVSAARGKEGAGKGAAALLAEADQAMYGAKQAGKNGVVFSERALWGAAAGPSVRGDAPNILAQ